MKKLQEQAIAGSLESFFLYMLHKTRIHWQFGSANQEITFQILPIEKVNLRVIFTARSYYSAHLIKRNKV